MVAVAVKSVLHELMGACKEAHTCFVAWSAKCGDDDLRRLLMYRARVCLRHGAEILALMEQAADQTCVGPDLHAGAKRRSWSDIRRMIRRVRGRSVFEACEAEDSRCLMRYRDALEFELPEAIRSPVAAQFSELIEQHARMTRIGTSGMGDCNSGLCETLSPDREELARA